MGLAPAWDHSSGPFRLHGDHPQHRRGRSPQLVWRGVTIEYSLISDRLFFGFESRQGYNLALPEKALLDCIYYRNTAPFADELELEELDARRLQELAQPFPVRVRKMVEKLMG